CRISQERVVADRQQEASVGLLVAMADHMTYELTRDFGRGYRYYLVYMDHLLSQRNYEDALVLAGVFWRLLAVTVVRASGPARPYYDLLAEARTVDYATITQFDRLHYIKLLRGQGAYQQAIAEAQAMYQQLAAESIVPTPDTLWSAARTDNTVL